MEQRIVKVKDYNLVKKHDALVKARQNLSLLANKLMSAVIGMIRKDDKDFQVYILKVADFKELAGLTGKGLSQKLYAASKELTKSDITIPRPNGWLLTTWASSAQYIDGSGEVEFMIDPKLAPYLLDLTEDFLKYELENVMHLKSSYIFYMYEFFKNEFGKRKYGSDIVEIEISLEDFREQFNVPESYKYDGLKSRILEKAVQEFKEKTDIVLEYDEHKRGRKVTRLTFKIVQNYDENFMKNEKSFISYMRKKFINVTIVHDRKKNIELSISSKGKIYDKITLKEYMPSVSKTVWSKWYQMAKDEELECLKTI